MPLGTLDRRAPSFFRQGPSALSQLVLYSALALFLMVADLRFKVATPVRAALATALYPVQWLVLQPVQALKIIPALRVDRVSGSFTDGLTKATSPVHDYGTITQPKISVAYAVRPDTSVYANWGRTFQMGAGIDSYRTASQSRNLDPSLNDGWEAGVKWQPTAGIETRVAYWEQRASGEVARVLGVNGLPDPGGQGNVGRTLRKGLDAQLNARLNAQWSGWVGYSSQIARIVEPDPSAPATRCRPGPSPCRPRAPKRLPISAPRCSCSPRWT